MKRSFVNWGALLLRNKKLSIIFYFASKFVCHRLENSLAEYRCVTKTDTFCIDEKFWSKMGDTNDNTLFENCR